MGKIAKKAAEYFLDPCTVNFEDYINEIESQIDALRQEIREISRPPPGEKSPNMDRNGHVLKKGCLVKVTSPDRFGIFDHAEKSGKYVNIYARWLSENGIPDADHHWRGQEHVTFICNLPQDCEDC